MPDDLAARTLFVDIELFPSGRLREVGAVLGDEAIRVGPSELGALDGLAARAEAVAGHNLLAHDLPRLRSARPGLALLRLPAIDTLLLSPLAFPSRPYHALVKDRDLVRDGNDPVADCRASRQVFEDARRALGGPLAHLARRALGELSAAETWSGGFERFFGETGGDLGAHLEGHACASALREALSGPALPLAYAAAWLRADPGSVLPRWVRLTFPEVPALVSRLRDAPCGGCAWCDEAHDPTVQLRRWFGLPGFRERPAGPDGGSLQEAIVRAGLQGRSLFAVMPTGGGKSIGFQLPALVRAWRRGLLTVVVSPLQSLMKDQVDGLKQRTGAERVAALNGLLTPPEREEVLRGVSEGLIGVLYLSPEQLRSPRVRKALARREVGGWVFDEAHCLTEWGHDFRTDYLYAVRFIRELAGEGAVPPVACFTATAQRRVQDEITTHLRDLGHEPLVFHGGVERDNLALSVRSVTPAGRWEAVDGALREHLSHREDGAGIVFAATRGGCERLAAFLRDRGWSVDAFHAGLDAPRKKAAQDAFLGGALRIVVATSAFGMGIDKPDVRVVVHAEIPGSLESYLQQAGRAGRDGEPAACILLFFEEDVRAQFDLARHGRLTLKQVVEILRAVRGKKKRREIWLTPGEIVRLAPAAALDDDRMATTKVATAVSWLEKGGFVKRDENRPQVFQGRPRVRDLKDLDARLSGWSERDRARARALVHALMQARADDGFDADALAAEAGFLDEGPVDAGRRVLELLEKLVGLGLLEGGTRMTAYVSRATSRARLDAAGSLERGLLARVAADPDPDADGAFTLDLRALNDALVADGLPSTPDALRRLVFRLADDRGPAEAQGPWAVRQAGRGTFRVTLREGFAALERASTRRLAAARVTLDALLARAEGPGEVLVDFALGDVTAALAADLALAPTLGEPLRAAERALLSLHDVGAVLLQRGLAVFRSAWHLTNADPRRFVAADFAPLERHDAERTLQIHVVGKYARAALAAPAQGHGLARDWFTLDRDAFLRRWMAGEPVKTPTTAALLARITRTLTPPQRAVVTAKPAENLLVVAGPGSGKTRVLVHRAAWLVEVARVPPDHVAVLCYNRGTAREIRRRLVDLLGDVGRRVRCTTLHALALRLSGRCLESFPGERGPDFDAMLDQAIAALADPDAREQAVGGLSHLLIDETQDLDARQAALIDAIVGRHAEEDRRLAVLAVGDDDQNIYAWRGTSNAFLRAFEADHRARRHVLADNHRSAPEIVAAANRIVDRLADRLKREPLEAVSREAGSVEVVDAPGLGAQAAWIREHLPADGTVAVLARHHRALGAVRHVLEEAGVAVRTAARDRPPLARVREIAAFLDDLRGEVGVEDLWRLLVRVRADRPENPWTRLLAEEIAAWAEEDPGRAPASAFAAALRERLADERGEPLLGEGVLLSTMHGAKGLEFDTVFVLDGDRRGDVGDDARRLLYVAMTRARRRLVLFRDTTAPDPELEGVCGIRRTAPPAPDVPLVESVVLGLGDVWLDWAGRQRDPAVHEALAALDVGDRVVVEEDRIVAGRTVAMLSRAAKGRFGGEGRVLAMVRWEGGDTHREALVRERWEVPVVELRRRWG